MGKSSPVPEVGLAGLSLDSPHSGSATYATNLVRHLPTVAPELHFRLFLHNPRCSAGLHPSSSPAMYPASSPTMYRTSYPTSIPATRLLTPLDRLKEKSATWARLDKLTWETVMLPLAAAACGDRLIHSLYFAAPLVSNVPVVVTVHDVIPLVLDGYHRGKASQIYSAFMARTVRHAAAIITVSDHARTDIVRALGVPEDRIFVTPEAVDERFTPRPEPGDRERVAAAYGLPDRFLLYLGGAERRKNLETLVSAWQKIESSMVSREVHLVLVANFPPPDSLYPDIPGLVRELGLRNVKFVQSVSEEDKPAVYRHALGFCFPSLYEGFGLTPLEAMASGLPVIASNATSIPEVVGSAALLVDGADVAAWAESMLHLVDWGGLRASLSARGLEQANAFSWLRTANLTADVYRTVLGS